MEINQELSDIYNNQKNIKDVIQEIKYEQDLLSKKLHIFKVMDIANEVEQMVKDNIFGKYDIKKIRFSHNYDYDIGNELTSVCLHEDDSEVFRYNLHQNYIEPINMLRNMLKKINNFEDDHINENFQKNGNYVFKTQDGIGEKIIEILLSKELKAIFEHGRLQNQLSQNNNTTRKMKI